MKKMAKRKPLPLSARDRARQLARIVQHNWYPLTPERLDERLAKVQSFKERIDLQITRATALAATAVRVSALGKARLVALELTGAYGISDEARVHASLVNATIGHLLDELERAIKEAERPPVKDTGRRPRS